MNGMASRRRLLVDRLMRPVRPKPVPEFTPPPRPVADGLWSVDRRLRLPGGAVIPCRMTVVRLPGGGLWLHSPVRLDAATREGLAALGPVEAVIAPNPFHYLFVADYADGFPRAGRYYAPGLRERIAWLPPATVLTDASPPSWAGALDQLVFGPVAGNLSEVVFRHRASGTLVLTDLAFNMTVIEPARDRWLWRLNGVPPSFGPSRSGRLTLLRDRRVAAPFLRRILRWEFDRIVVNHGEVLAQGGPAAFRRGFLTYLAGT
jgi:hypothetical protein